MKNYISIGKAAEYLGVSEQTLRRWDASGEFPASHITPGGHRYYSLADLAVRTKGLFQVATEWVMAPQGIEPDEQFYCRTSDVFKVRLERMSFDMEQKASLRDVGPAVVAIAGEIGNNSFDHNLGSWPDAPGVLFAFDLGKRVILLADRGVGVLATLRAIKPELADDKAALETAFTQVVSGRFLEHRGNGLKFVRRAVTQGKWRLRFYSGSALAEFKDGDYALKPSIVSPALHGTLAYLEF